jgi:low affinity Fe/Cu permease
LALPRAAAVGSSRGVDTAAVQAKLDELIRVTEGHEALVGVEERTQDEIDRIKTERNQSR